MSHKNIIADMEQLQVIFEDLRNMLTIVSGLFQIQPHIPHHQQISDAISKSDTMIGDGISLVQQIIDKNN